MEIHGFWRLEVHIRGKDTFIFAHKPNKIRTSTNMYLTPRIPSLHYCELLSSSRENKEVIEGKF